MKIFEDERVSRWAIQQIRDKMGGRDRTGLWHASEVFQCLRKSILMRREPELPSTEDILIWTTGFAVQEWFLGDEDESEEHFGILLSPDKIVGDNVIEFKTTRQSYEKFQRDDNNKYLKHLPKEKFDPRNNEMWIKRTRAYCAAAGIKRAHIMVFFLMSNLLKTWTLEFTDAELTEAQNEITQRKKILDRHNFHETVPSTKYRIGEWECKWCPKKLYCFPAAGSENGVERSSDT